LVYRAVEFEKKPEDDEENKEKNLNLQLFQDNHIKTAIIN